MTEASDTVFNPNEWRVDPLVSASRSKILISSSDSESESPAPVSLSLGVSISQDPNVGISDIPPPSLSPFSSPLSSFSLSQPTPSNARSTRLTPTTDSLGILPVTIIGSMVPSSATPLQSSPTTPNIIPTPTPSVIVLPSQVSDVSSDPALSSTLPHSSLTGETSSLASSESSPQSTSILPSSSATETSRKDVAVIASVTSAVVSLVLIILVIILCRWTSRRKAARRHAAIHRSMGVHIVRGSTGALTDESAVWRDSAFNPPSLSGRTMVTDVPSIPRDWADDLSSMHGSQILGISGAPPRTPTPPPLSPGLLKDLYTGTSPTHLAPSALAKPEIIYIASPAQPMTQLAPELSHGNRVSHSSPLSIVATYPESQRDRRSTMSTVIPLTTPDAEPGSWNPFRNSVRSLLTQASGETEGSRYSYHSALPSSTLSGGNMYFQNVPPVPAIPEQYVSSIQASHGHGQEEERRVNRRGMVATPKPGPKLNMTSVKLGRGGYHSSMTPSPGDNIDMFLDLQPPNARLGDVDTERQHLRGLPAHEVYRNSGTG